MRERGFVKRTHWCPADVCEDVAEILRYLKDQPEEAHAAHVRLTLNALAAYTRRSNGG